MASSNSTLCWECSKATGGCAWSNNLEPVNGWDAVLVKKTTTRPYDTYRISNCPEFNRDATNNGLTRHPKGTTI